MADARHARSRPPAPPPRRPPPEARRATPSHGHLLCRGNRSFERVGRIQRRFGNTPQHPAKHHFMNGPEQIPIQQSSQTTRLEICDLADDRGFALRFCAEFEPCPPRGSHLRQKPQPEPWLVTLHAPEIQSAARQRNFWIGPPAPHTHPASHQIQQPPDPPQQVAKIPARPASNPANRSKRLIGRERYPRCLFVAQNTGAGFGGGYPCSRAS